MEKLEFAEIRLNAILKEERKGKFVSLLPIIEKCESISWEMHGNTIAEILSIATSDYPNNILTGNWENCCLYLIAYFETFQDKMHTQVFEIISMLHDQLLQLLSLCEDEKYLPFLEVVLYFCEVWWKRDMPDRDNMVNQFLPCLLLQFLSANVALDEKRSKVSISMLLKKLNAVRDGFLCFDYEDESIQLLKELILRCFLDPKCIEHPEGIKLLVFFVGNVHESLTNEIHMVIKNQLHVCSRPSIAKQYGVIYYKAWKDGKFKKNMEDHCIQPMIQLGIHAKHNKHFKMLASLVQVFHDNKRHPGVDEMLFELYQPIIWRALHAANSAVRYQATCFFVACFPLRSPHFDRESTEQLLNKQLEVLDKLLLDDHAAVRVAAVKGSCKIMCAYWEILPIPHIQRYLTTLASKLLQDASSPKVRASVLEGITFILDNHMSHTLLAKALPLLGKSLFDTARQVQVALIELLVRVEKIKEIPLGSIVPIEDLFLVWGNAAGNAAGNATKLDRVFTKLFLKSYFPTEGTTGAFRVSRTIALMRKNFIVAKSFYSNVYKYESVGSISKLIVLLFRYISLPKENAEIQEAPSEVLEIVEILISSILRVLLKYPERYDSARILLLQELEWNTLFPLISEDNGMGWQLISAIYCLMNAKEEYYDMQQCILQYTVREFSKLTWQSPSSKVDAIASCLITWNESFTVCQHTLQSLEGNDRIDTIVGLSAMEKILESSEIQAIVVEKYITPLEGYLFTQVDNSVLLLLLRLCLKGRMLASNMNPAFVTSILPILQDKQVNSDFQDASKRLKIGKQDRTISIEKEIICLLNDALICQPEKTQEYVVVLNQLIQHAKIRVADGDSFWTSLVVRMVSQRATYFKETSQIASMDIYYNLLKVSNPTIVFRGIVHLYTIADESTQLVSNFCICIYI